MNDDAIALVLNAGIQWVTLFVTNADICQGGSPGKSYCAEYTTRYTKGSKSGDSPHGVATPRFAQHRVAFFNSGDMRTLLGSSVAKSAKNNCAMGRVWFGEEARRHPALGLGIAFVVAPPSAVNPRRFR